MFSKFIKFFLIVVVVIALTNLFIYFKTRAHIYQSTDEVPSAQAVLIPGAAVFSDGRLSDFFRDRVEKGLELYRNNKVEKILVSGDNSTVWHNEVNPVRDFLLERGVPEEDIFLDHAGFDTYSSMYRARDIFKAESLIIATQSFHLPRAVFIARSLGLPAYGINVAEGKIPAENYVREVLANEKAVLNLLTSRKPKFLGEEIPLAGPAPKYPEE